MCTWGPSWSPCYNFLKSYRQCLFNDPTCEFGREGVKIKYAIWKFGVDFLFFFFSHERGIIIDDGAARVNFSTRYGAKSSPIDISRQCTVIGFHLSTSDTTGSAIQSSKPNPILIDVRERRGVTIARIIFGATNTTYSTTTGRPPDLDELLSYYILTRDGESERNLPGHRRRPSIG